MLAGTIERKRKGCYAALERNNKELEITDWHSYFAGGIFSICVKEFVSA